MKKIKTIFQVINIYFKLKVKPWQISAVIDIIRCKKELLIIAGTSAGKNLVYQPVQFVTNGLYK